MNTGRLVGGLSLLLGVAMIPGIVGAFIPEARHAMADALWLTLAAIAAGGALGGALLAWGQEPIWVGAVCGALGTLSTNAALYYYASWRSSLYKIEVLFIMLLASIPAALLLAALRRKPQS